jgi:hypothetical protein
MASAMPIFVSLFTSAVRTKNSTELTRDFGGLVNTDATVNTGFMPMQIAAPLISIFAPSFFLLLY